MGLAIFMNSCKPRIVQVEDSVTLTADEVTSEEFTEEFSGWPSDETILVSLRRTPCMGRCPVYRLEVFENGIVRYTGVQFTDRLGTYWGRISPQDLEPIVELAENIGFKDLEGEYPTGGMRIMDLPTSTVYIKTTAWQKSVVSRNYANPDVTGEQKIVENLKALQDAVDQLIIDLSFHLVGEGLQD